MTGADPTGAGVVAHLLASAELFSQLEPAVLEELARELEVVRLASGETLMRAGEPGDCMYILLGGRLLVFVPSPEGGERLVRRLAAGESVGEMALITEGPRSATVVAKRDCELVKIPRAWFHRLVSAHPERMMAMMRSVADRLVTVEGSARRDRSVSILAVVPASPEVSIDDFAARLVAALRSRGEVLHLDRARFERVHGAGAAEEPPGTSPRNRRIGDWLTAQEAEHRFVLLQADHLLSAWTRRCMGEADQAVLVAAADSEPTIHEVGEAVPRPLAGAEWLGRDHCLVLLQPPGTGLPAGTRRWLRGRGDLPHYHLRLDRPADMERLARILAGDAVGLVLGGGGARGFAHIGVIRALEEAGVPVDLIGGVSMGAIVAAQYAMGRDPATMLRDCRRAIVDSRLGRDFTLPIVSLNRGKRFERGLRLLFGDADVEDLWLTYFCVSCDLSNAETVEHREGALWRAVKASNSVPGLLPPVVEAGNLLVDGGVVNNEPGDLMMERSTGPAIVVDVSQKRELAVAADTRELPPAWKILLHRLSPFHAPLAVPSAASVMMRALMVGSLRKSQEVEGLTEHYLRPAVGGFRMDDYARIEEIVEAGYRSARDQIAAWPSLPGAP